MNCESRQEVSPGTARTNTAVRLSCGNSEMLNSQSESTSDMFEDPSTKNIKVRVAVRIRPLIKREVRENTVGCVLDDPVNNEIIIGRQPKQRRFTYDYVLGPSSSQQDVFDKCHVASLVDGCFHGYNATIFAYGQTGSGKTYTMGSCRVPESDGVARCRKGPSGYENDSIGSSFAVEDNMTSSSGNALFGDNQFKGILPRVASRLFSRLSESNEHQASVDGSQRKMKYTVRMTFIEIHKEKVRDLLRPDANQERVAVRDDGRGGIRISGLKPITLKSEADLLTHVNRGCILRTTGKTLMNDRSSRSHALITLMLEQEYDLTEDEVRKSKITRKSRKKRRNGFGQAETNKRAGYRCAKLHIVDLAGSERQKRTGAVGNRFQESVRINQGLLALGNVISALGDPRKSRRRHHVPYRESKLTRLLQDSLGGNSQTLMIACITPALNSLEETLNVLKYANRARNIKNKARVNVEPELPEISDDEDDEASLTEEGDLNEEDEEEMMVEDLELEGYEKDNTTSQNAIKLNAANAGLNESLFQSEREKMQVQLNLQKCQDELTNVKNELVSSEARVSFLLDKIHDLEEERRGTERERSQLKQALIDARKDLERDEVIFAEKMRQMAGLQKKATKFYEDKKKLKEEIASLKAQLMERSVSPPSSESLSENIRNGSQKLSNINIEDIGIQTSFDVVTIGKPEVSVERKQDATVQVHLSNAEISIDGGAQQGPNINKTGGERDDGTSESKKSIDFVSAGLMSKSAAEEDDGDEVTIMIGEESFAAATSSPMKVVRAESGKENIAPVPSVSVEGNDEVGEMELQRSNIEVSSTSAQLTAAWLEDVTDKFVQRNEDKEFLMNKTARLRVLNSEKEKAALALRNSMTVHAHDQGSSVENNLSNLDSELLENHLEALEVEVEVEKAAVNNLQNTMTSDPKVGLADIYQALDDLEEGEARALLRRCCSRMAKLKRERGKYESELNQRNMIIQEQGEQLTRLEMTLHQSSLEYDRRLKEQRQKYESKMGSLLRRSMTNSAGNKPITVRMSRKQLREINPFD